MTRKGAAVAMATTSVRRRRFTVDEYYEMASAGILRPDERLELIDGEVISMSPIGSPHAACVRRSAARFSASASRRYAVSVQSPVRLSEFSEPEPDIALLRFREDFYVNAHPIPADVLLIIEVSDITLRHDRSVKVPMYAEAGVPEVWLVNLPAKTITVYRRPEGRSYVDVLTVGRGESIALLAMPDLVVAVNDILG